MKKLIAVLLAALMLPITTAFAEDVTVSIPAFKVTFNKTTVENNFRQYPLIVYKDITYVPMTYYDCRYLGISTDWNGNSGTLTIGKSDITCAYRDYKWDWKNSKNCRASVCSFNIIVNGKEIDNSKEEYPLLTFRDVTYFPLTWHFAVDEFGWEYSFDSKNGLCINSDVVHAERINLPNLAGSCATDGKYYYYNGDSGEKHVVYRALMTDTQNPEIIFEHPDSGMSRRVNFVESEGDVYFYYTVGSSPVMSRRYVRKIQPDGALTEEIPAYYSYSAHGYSEVYARGNGISLKGVNPFFDSATEFTYEIDGVETKVDPLPGRVRIGKRRDGKVSNSSDIDECIKIFGDKIYYTAADLDTNGDSALYCIDTKTGKAQKLIDGVFGFHVYNGWVGEEGADSTMIIYDTNGTLMRYTELNGEIRQLETADGEDIVLVAATGGQRIYTYQKALDGTRTVVKAFDDYASGYGSINATVMDTTTGTNYTKSPDFLCAYTSGESPNDDVRLVVPTFCYLSDAAYTPFIYEDILIYRIEGENDIVKVKLNH